MNKCSICGVKVRDSNHPKHIESKKHQNALKKREAKEVQAEINDVGQPKIYPIERPKQEIVKQNPKLENSKQAQKFAGKLTHRVKDFLSIAEGFVLYVWNERNLNCKLVPLPKIRSVLRVNQDETFEIGKPSLVIDGKPLFIVVRGIPYSITVELRDIALFLRELKFNESEIKEKIPVDTTMLVQEGYSASEIDAKIHSVYTQRMFRAPRFTMQNVIIVLLTIVSSCMITYMITSMYFRAVIEGMG